ncbi:non-specific serine/threonine protein kinase [Entamoeba marina]
MSLNFWGILKSLNSNVPSLKMYDNEIIVGQSNEKLNLTIIGISSKHFLIQRKKVQNQTIITIQDTSTNGTFLNNQRLVKNEEITIEMNDIISIFNPLKNKNSISFVFIDNSFEEKENSDCGIFERYNVIGYLGKGSYGVVRLVIDQENKKEYAMKVIGTNKKKLTETSKRESDLLQIVNHQHIIQLHEVLRSTEHMYIIMECIYGGTLKEYVKQRPLLEEEVIRNISKQILEALSYLHEKNIIHRDLKLENVLLLNTNTINIKITDFGLGKIIDSNTDNMTKTRCGTCEYISPELLKGKEYNGYKNDIWGAGVLMYVLATKKFPFLNENDVKPHKYLIYNIINNKRSYCQEFKERSLEFKDIIDNMLNVDPMKRFAANDCLNHLFFGRKHILETEE